MRKKTITLIFPFLAILLFVSYFAFDSEKLRKRQVDEVSPDNESAATSLAQYEESIDYSCNSAADCEIKDVHNCCGYYPKCVNVNAKTDPEFVRMACGREKTFGICGFPEIAGCECAGGRCREVLQ